MKKHYFLLLILFVSFTVHSQIGIKTKNPDPSSVVDIKSSDKGVLVPRMSTTERNLISNPAVGLIIYNTSTQCNEYYTGKEWYSLCWRGTGINLPTSNGTAVVEGFSCEGEAEGVLIKSTPPFGVSQTLIANVVNVGTYNIKATVNGVTFTGKGEFKKKGYNKVVLTATGSPLEVGDYTFVLNTVPNCEYERNVANSESGGTAILSITDCGVARGNLLKNELIREGVEQDITLSVTEAGSYSITAYTDGVVFHAEGSLEVGTNQKVTLKGTGTPTVVGASAFTLNLLPTCTFVRDVKESVVITKQPVTPSPVCSENGIRTINVIATGTVQSYTWQKDGVAVVNGNGISGQGTSTLTFTNPLVSLAGSYDVVISGADSVTSRAVPVVVNATPIITTAPAVERFGTGEVTLTAVSSTGKMNWYATETNGKSLSSSSTFKTNIEATTTFYVEATSAACASASRTAVEARVKIPSVTRQLPATATLCSRTTSITLSIEAEGADTYKWRKDGMTLDNNDVIRGQGTASIVIDKPSGTDGGNYDVVLSNSAGMVISSATAVRVAQVPVLTNWKNGNISAVTKKAELVATPSSGQVKWYESKTSAVPLGIGNTFVTPELESPKTYYALAEDSGCVSSDMVSIKAELDIPIITTQPVAPSPSCARQGVIVLSVVATAVDPPTYLWKRNGVDLTDGAVFSGTTSNTLTITAPALTDAGNFYVVVSNRNGAVNSNTVSVQLLETPVISASNGANTCGRGTATLSVTAADTSIINWYSAATGGTSLFAGATFTTPQITATTTYYAEATINGSSCKSVPRTSVVATVSSALVVTPTKDNPSICGVGDIKLVANVSANADKVRWYKDGVATPTEVAPGAELTINLPTIGSYSYSVTAYDTRTLCESDKKPINISANANPTVTTTTAVNVCGADKARLTASASEGANKLRWYTPANVMTEQDISLSYDTAIVNVGAPQKYNVEGYNSTTTCVSPKTEITVTAVAKPVVTTTTTVNTCGASTVDLIATATDADKLRWYPPTGSMSEINIGERYTTGTITGTVTYQVSGYKSSTSCESDKTNVVITSTTNSVPVITTATSVNSCGGAAVNLTATVTNGDKIKWYNPAGEVSSLDPSVPYTTLPLAEGANPATYQASGFNTTTNCESAKVAISVIRQFNPVVTLESNSLSVCGTGPVELKATGLSAGDKIRWYDPADNLQELILTEKYTTASIVAGAAAVTYKVSGYNTTNKCESAKTSITIVAKAKPTLTAETMVSSCGGASVELTVTDVVGADKVKWYVGTTATEIDKDAKFPVAGVAIGGSATYQVTAYNSTTKCESDKTTVTVSGKRIPILTATKQTIYACDGASVDLTATVDSEADKVRWYKPGVATPEDRLPSIAYSTTPIALGATAIYSVSAYNSVSKCESEKKNITVSYKIIPTVTTLATVTKCGAGVASLTATVDSNGDKVRWYPPTGSSTDLGSGAVFSTDPIVIGTPQTYNVTGLDTTTGCESVKKPVVVTAAEIPVVETNATVYRCGAGSSSLSATGTNGADKLRWYNAAGNMQELSLTDQYITASQAVGASDVYRVSAYNSSSKCESLKKDITLICKVLPTVSTTTTVKSCGIGTVKLKATAANGDKVRWYNYLSEMQMVDSGAEYTTASIDIGRSDIYNVEAFDSTSKCTSTTKTTVTVIGTELPTVTAIATQNRCGTGNITLLAIASAADKVRWYDSTGTTMLGEVNSNTSFTTSTAINEGDTATYKVAAYNSSTLCESAPKVTVSATANVLPTVTTEASKVRCGSGTVELVATVANGGDKVKWYNSADVQQGPDLAVDAIFTTAHISAGATPVIYKVRALNSSTSCLSAISSINVSASSDAAPVITTKTDVLSCGAGTAKLYASVTGGDKIKWYNAVGVLQETLDPSLPFTTPVISLGSTVYFKVSGYNSTSRCESDKTLITVRSVSTQLPTVVTNTSLIYCIGGSGNIDLVATGENGGNKIRWYSASDVFLGEVNSGDKFTTPISVLANASVIFKVTAYNSNGAGCESSTKTHVTVTGKPMPEVNALAAQNICGAGTAPLLAVAIGADRVRWYDSTGARVTEIPSNTPFVTPNIPLGTTLTYKVTAYNTATLCETAPQKTVTATANTFPTVTTNATASSCGGATATLIATAADGGDMIKWYNSAGVLQGEPINSGSSFTTAIVPVGTTVVYKVSGYNSTTTCESATKSVNVTGQIVPTVSISSTNISTCGSTPIPLTATAANGGTFVRWYNEAGTQLAQIVSGSPYNTENLVVGTNKYFVSGYNPTTTCESAKTAVTVTSKPLPTVTIPSTSVYGCGAGSVSLTANSSDADKIKWFNSSDVQIGLPLDSGTPFTTPILAVGDVKSYKVSAYNTTSTCESPKTTVTVTVVVIPIVSTIATISSCGQNPVRLTATTGVSTDVVRWYDPAGVLKETLPSGATFTTELITSTTVYSVAGYNATTNCESARKTITITPTSALIPTVSVDKTIASICGTGTIVFKATAANGGDRVRWYNSSDVQQGSDLVSDADFTTATITAGNTETYKVSAINSATGCESAKTIVSATANFIPTVTPTKTDEKRCNTGTVSLIATATNADKVRWYEAADAPKIGEVLSGTAFTSPTVIVANPRTFRVTGYNSSTTCESAMTPVTVTAVALPTVSVPNPAESRCGSGTVELTATAGNGATKIKWYNSSGVQQGPDLESGAKFTTATILVGATSVYKVSGYDPITTCSSDLKTVDVTAYSPPTVTTTQSVSICGAGMAKLLAGATGATKVRWFDSTGTTVLTTIDSNTEYTTENIVAGAVSTFYVAAYNETTTCLSEKSLVTVTSVTLPTINTTASVATCSGVSVALAGTVTAADRIKWYDSAAVQLADVSANDTYTVNAPVVGTPAIYFAEAFNSTKNCKSAKSQVTVTARALPTVVVSSAVSRCGEGTIDIKATSDASKLKWFDANDIQQGQPKPPADAFTTATIIVGFPKVYKVSALDESTTCESAKTLVTATANAIPTVTTTQTISSCGTAKIQLTATAGNEGNKVRWYDSAGTTKLDELTSGSPFTTPVDLVIGGTVIYKVDGYNSTTNCYSAMKDVTITSTAIPTVTTTQTISTCGPNPIQLTATAADATHVKWYNSDDVLQGNPIVSGANFTTGVLTEGTNVIYKVSAYNPTTKCESPKTVVTLTVNAVPSVSTALTVISCGGRTLPKLKATATGADKVKWYDSAGTTELIMVDSGTGEYQVSAVPIGSEVAYQVAAFNSTTSCLSPKTKVTVKGAESPTVSTLPFVQRCGTGTVKLIATAQGVADQVKWYDSSDILQDTVSSDSAFTTTTINVGAAATIYKVTAFNSASSCESETKIEVRVSANPLPTVSLNAANANQQRCGTGTFNIIATGADGGDKIKWYSPSDQLLTTIDSGATFLTPTDVVAGAGYVIYKVASYSTASGCSSAKTDATLFANVLPTVTLASTSNRCGAGTIKLKAFSNTDKVKWYNEVNTSATVDSNVEYTSGEVVIGTNLLYKVSGYNSTTTCESAKTDVVLVANAYPTVSVANATEARCGAGTFSLIAIAEGTGYKVQWYNSSDVALGEPLFSGVPFVTPIVASGATVTYKVKGLNSTTGCASTSFISVAVTANILPVITTTSEVIICSTGTATLVATATNADKVQWYNSADLSQGVPIDQGATFTTEEITTGTQKTYKVEARNTTTTCISPKTSVTVIAKAPFTVNTPASAVRCGTGTVDIVATAVAPANKVKWYNAAGDLQGTAINSGETFTTASITAGATATVYKVSAYNSADGCESAKKEVSVLAYEKPAVTATAEVARCGDGSVNLIATSTTADRIRWYNSSGLTLLADVESGVAYSTTNIPAGLFIDFKVSAYSSTSKCETQTKSSVRALANVVPTVQIDRTAETRCGAGTVNLVARGANGGDKVKWYDDSNNSTTVNSGVAHVSTIQVGTVTYHVSALNSTTTCESPKSAVNITGIALPTVTVESVQSRCGTGVLELMASVGGGDKLKWYNSLDIQQGGLLNPYDKFRTTVPTTEGTSDTYKVSGINTATGCESALKTIAATANLIPSAVITTDLARCGTGTVDIQATVTNGDKVKWFSVTNDPLTIVNSAATFTTSVISEGLYKDYKWQAYNSTTQCVSASATVRVSSTTVPSVYIARTTETRCGAGTFNLIASAANGGNKVVWYNSDGVVQSTIDSGATFTTPILAEATTIFKVAGLNSTSSCTSELINITLNVIPTPVLITENSVSRCGDGSVGLVASVTDGDKIKWRNAAGTVLKTISSGEVFTTPSAVIAGTSVVYKVSALNSSTSCETALTDVTVTANAMPAVSTNASVLICGTGTASLVANATNADKVKWYNSADVLQGNPINSSESFTTSSVNQGNCLDYSVSAYNSTTLCESPKTAVRLVAIEKPTVTTQTAVSRCGDGTVALTAFANGGADKVRWYLNNVAVSEPILSGTAFTTAVVVVGTPVTYSVEAIYSEASCASLTKTSVTVTAIAAPTVTLTTTNLSRCGTGNFSLIATATNADKVRWYDTSNETPLDEVLSATAFTTTTVSAGESKTYKFSAYSTANVCESSKTDVIVNATVLPTVTPSKFTTTRCGTGTVALSATADRADKVRWFTANDVAIPGAEVNVGVEYTLPSVNEGETVIFKVESFNSTSNCVSPSKSQVSITATSLPSVITETTQTRCGTGTIPLVASTLSSNKLRWYNASEQLQTEIFNGETFTPSTPLEAGATAIVFKVSSYDTNTQCESAKTSVNASAASLPVVTTTANVFGCGSGAVNLLASSDSNGNQVQWYDNANNKLGNPINSGVAFATPYMGVGTTATYKVTAFSSITKCESPTKTTVNISVVNTPVVEVASNTVSRCGAGTVDLNTSYVSGADKVKWYNAVDELQGSPIVAGSIFTTNTIELGAAIVFKVAAYSSVSQCESAKKVVSVTANALPTGVTTSTAVSTCGTAPVNLKVTAVAGGDRVKWYNGAGVSQGIFNIEENFTTPSITIGTTIFKAAAYNSITSCEAATPTNVTITNISLSTVTTNSTVYSCGGSSVNLTATPNGGDQLKWYDSSEKLLATSGPLVPFATSTMIVGTTIFYKVSSFNTSNGCESPKSSIAVYAVAMPTISTKLSETRCDTGTVTLQATAIAADKIRWYNPIGDFVEQNAAAPYITQSIVAGVEAVIYKASAYNPTNGCESTKTNINISAVASPVVTTDTNVGGCDTGRFNLVATTTSGNKIKWYSAADIEKADLNSGDIFISDIVSLGTVVKYKVKAYSLTSTCQSQITEVNVSASARPSVQIAQSITRCDAGTFDLVAVAGNGGTQVKWYTESGVAIGSPIDSGVTYTTPVISAGATAKYQVSAYNPVSTCESLKTMVTLQAFVAPTVSSTASISQCGTGSSVLEATVTNANKLVWYDSTGLTVLQNSDAIDSFTTPQINLGSSIVFKVAALNSSNSCLSPKINVTVTANNIPSVDTQLKVFQCGLVNGAKLSATVANGADKIRWYNISETLLDTKEVTEPFTAGVINRIDGFGIYKVAAFNSVTGCHSPLKQITITAVNTPVLVTAETSKARCGDGTVEIYASASFSETSTKTRWYRDGSIVSNVTGGLVAYGSNYVTEALMGKETPYNYAVEAFDTATGCVSTTRNPVTVTVTTTPTVTFPLSTTNICGNSGVTVTLSGTVTNGDQIRWYTNESDSEPFFTGLSYTTPILVATKSLYVSGYNSTMGCKSSVKTKIDATIISTPYPITPIVTGVARCGEPENVTLSVAPGANTTYMWYASSTGGTALATGNAYSFYLSSAVTYYVEGVNGNCVTSQRFPVVASITPMPSVVTTTGNTRCLAGTVTISATPSSGATISWWNAAGVKVAEGNSFTTPDISASTDYFAQANYNSCSSPKTAVTAAVTTQFPITPIVTGVTRCGGPESVTLSVAPGANTTYMWYASSTGGTALATGNTYSFNLSSAVTYYVEGVNGNCVTSPRVPVVASITPMPSVVSTTGNTRCLAGTVTISATPSSGAAISWWNAAGVKVAEGNSFTTPNISASTDYFAQANYNNCSSPKTAVTATVVNSVTAWFTQVPPTTGVNDGTIYYWYADCSPSNAYIHWYFQDIRDYAGGGYGGTGGTGLGLYYAVTGSKKIYARAELDGCSGDTPVFYQDIK